MNEAIYRIINGALDLDVTITPADKQAILEVCTDPKKSRVQAQRDPRKLRTLKQVGEILQLSQASVYRLVKSL